MAVTSNVDEIAEWLRSLGDCLDFTRPGIEGSVGKDMLIGQAYRIDERCSREEGPTEAWAENQGKYAKKKDTLHLPVGIGIAPPSEERMLSILNLKGEQIITAKEATMIYGAAGSASGPDDPSPRNKAAWFTNGSEGADGERSGAKNQPDRPFYEYTEDDVEASVDIAVDAIDRFIDEKMR